jgi:hypothetical protein
LLGDQVAIQGVADAHRDICLVSIETDRAQVGGKVDIQPRVLQGELELPD